MQGTVGLRSLVAPRRLRVLALAAAIFVVGCASDEGASEQSTASEAPTTTTTTTTTPVTSTVDSTTSTSQAPATTTTTQAPSTTTTTEAPQPDAWTLDQLLELDRPLVIAHAGGDQDYPHSTIYAYAQAAAVGADILELDVQLTADGVLIVQHDDTVDRTTEATGPVAELTLSEIKALDNAYWFLPGRWGDQTQPDEEYVFRGVRTGEVEPPPGFEPDDFSVATFREVAERFPNHVLDVEIKLQSGPDGEPDPRTGAAAAEVLAAEIAELGREQSVIVASFNDETLAAMNELAPSVATSPGLNAMLAWFLSGAPLDSRYQVLQVPLTFEGVEVVTQELTERIHEEGRHVWVWLSGTDVVETAEFYADLLERGVDGLIAGRPAEAVAAISE
ncbi:MAG: glycerophosphodiester phosphodiesterase [Acidimicrobiaceae bacterium]|nr:glycerophosphodiester phosphodiesterase [Acidimicrobiaceae bacterium]MYD05365.1 glycerophosphodiester phosphodiesterase [Acidimicrobiaceae bacterium]MYI59823.1 glycerophosphodiester phosphodiesterase [Acidimicrobiaceae bacterium]